jgi:hypothetical protein
MRSTFLLLQVIIEAKVMAVKRDKALVTINGREAEMEEFHVSDESGTIPLKVWGKQVGELEVNSSYLFTCVGTRMFEYPYLTTTSKTVFKRTDDLLAAIMVPEIDTNVVIGSIVVANVVLTKRCSACKAPINCLSTSGLIRCLVCHMKQKAAAVNVSVKADVHVQDGTKTLKLAMNDKVIKGFVGINYANTDEVEDFLLLKDSWEVTYKEAEIISASFK